MLISFSSQKTLRTCMTRRAVFTRHTFLAIRTLFALASCSFTGLFARFNLVVICVLRTPFTYITRISRAFLVTAALHSLLSFHSPLSLSSLTLLSHSLVAYISQLSLRSRRSLSSLPSVQNLTLISHRPLLFPLFKSHACFTSLLPHRRSLQECRKSTRRPSPWRSPQSRS
jgi:hypothetical protein